jgi:hypothetical protein
MDFDPRDYDSRDDDRSALDQHRRARGNSHDDLDRDDDLRLPEAPARDRNDDARDLGRGPGDSRQSNAVKHCTIRVLMPDGQSATTLRVRPSREI